jgi:ABC-type cobalamin/Fe3+-siderophores transport system ATPase subunit
VKLAADDLVLSYGAAPIVDHVTLHIPEGKVSAFLGPNGSGKSTIFRALARLLRPRHGSVVIDGTAIGSMTTKQVARKLAILPQQPVTPESITVEDLIWYGRHPHRKPLVASGAADREAVEWAIRATQLEGLRAHPVDALSGGQRQRAWIALALAQDTSILLLDEPTTFLDLSHQLEVLELCAELNRDRGKTIVMVLHDVNLAAEFCDHLFVIKNGQVFTQGSPEQVLTRELIRDVYDVDAQVIPHPVSGRPLCIPCAKSPRVGGKADVTMVSMVL